MKKRAKMAVCLICLLAVLVCCISCRVDLSNRTTYKGFPVYQYNAESHTVEIDGVSYREVSELPTDTISVGDVIGYIWYEPHFEVDGGAVYTLGFLTDYSGGEYLYAHSAMYKIGKVPKHYTLLLERVG